MSDPGATARQAEELSASRLAAIVENSNDAIVGKDLNGIITSWNQGAERIFGYSAAEMIGSSILRLIPPELQHEENHILETIRQGGRIEHYETRRRTKSGRLIDISITVSPIKNASGAIVGISKIARDITELKAHQREVSRMSRLYAALSQINQTIVLTRNREELFERICRVLVEFGKFSMAWIGMPDAKTSRVNPVAQWGDKTGYLSQVSIYADDRPEGQGPMGRAIREDKRCVYNDFTRDADAFPWREPAERAGFQAAAAFPIRRRGAVCGAVMVYSDEISFFRDMEIALLDEAASDVSFAIDYLAQEEERKQAELAMRETEERYRALFDRSLDCVFLNDFAGNFLDANQAALDLLGYQREDIASLSFASLLSADQLPLAFQVTEEVKTTGFQRRPTEFRLRGKDGRQVFVETQSSMIYREGKPFAIQGIGRDLAERRQAEESLRLLHSAVLQAKESIVITNAQLDFPGPNIVFVNPAFTRITGYSAGEAMGKTPRILQGPRTDRNVIRRLRKTLERGEVFDGEAIQYRKDGTEYVQEWQITPLRDGQGKITHFLSIQRDITSQRRLEEQFRQAQKMEAFGQLAGGVAHDFNNILAVIQLQAGLLKMKPDLSVEQVGLADEIEKAADRGANLTRQLLLFSRKQTMQPRNIKLTDVIAEFAKMLQRALGEQFALKIKSSGEPLVIHADVGMIDQILLNLTVNARDAMSRGGVIVIETKAVVLDEVLATQTAKGRPGSFVCLSVIDNGCGIPPENLPRIFEPFFTTKEVGKGTGLGLATVFGIVEQHQGWIDVYSEVGRGTTFKVYLPRVTDPSGLKATGSQPVSLGGGDETILIVEDEKPLRAALKTTLQRLGYNVLEAAAGDEALEIWRQHAREIRLVLTDLVMPGGMTGIALAEKLLAQNPNLKVIYASGYSAEISHPGVVLEEDRNFIGKPFQAHKLAKIIRTNLDELKSPQG